MFSSIYYSIMSWIHVLLNLPIRYILDPCCPKPTNPLYPGFMFSKTYQSIIFLDPCSPKPTNPLYPGSMLS